MTMGTRRLATTLAGRKGSGAGLWPKWGGAMVAAPAAVAAAPRAGAAVAAAPWRRAATSGAASEVVVFGGNGFVGSQVCKALVGMGLRVAAINRSGAPREREEWMSGVDYIAADVFEPAAWRSVLHGAVGVVAGECVSCTSAHRWQRRLCAWIIMIRMAPVSFGGA